MRFFNPCFEETPGGGHGNSLQYSCLENPMGSGAWRAIVHRFAKSGTQLKQLSLLCKLGTVGAVESYCPLG